MTGQPTAAVAQPPARVATRALLDVVGLNVSYGQVHAVRDVSFSVAEHSGVGIIGANGAGKTSTLKALLRLIPAQAEQITFAGKSLLHTRPHRIVELGIGYVPEGRHVFPGLSVRKNLLLGAYRHKWDDTVNARLARIHELFPTLREFDKRLAGALSGGQQQMLAIGRALMTRPSLLLLDEPLLGLAPALQLKVIDAIRQIGKSGITVLVADQYARPLLPVIDRGYVIESGAITVAGSGKELMDNPHVRAAYFGI